MTPQEGPSTAGQERHIPPDLRYVPKRQKEYLCVPTNIQMIMAKHALPEISEVELGRNLGLVIPTSKAHLFPDTVESSDTPPRSGYGTRIYDPEFNPTKVFKKLGIPLTLEEKPISTFTSREEFTEYLKTAEEIDRDILLCFNHGALVDDPKRNWGHVTLFDRIIDGKIRIIDPNPEYPEWRTVPIEKMFRAMQIHGDDKSAGAWEIQKIE